MTQEQNQILTDTYKEIAIINKLLTGIKKLTNEVLHSQIRDSLIDEMKAKHDFINQVLAIAED